MSSSPPSTFRLLTFDWHGTLTDSTRCVIACMEYCAHELDLEVPPEAELRAVTRLRPEDVCERLCPGASPEVQKRAIELYRQQWFSTYRHLPIIRPGVHEALAGLIDEGYSLALATGRERLGLEQGLESTGLKDAFVAIRTSGETADKPDPQMLFEIMEELGMASGETLVVGDAILDLEMAQRAQVAAVAVLNGFHTRERLASYNPVACLESVVDLPGWLRS